MGKQRKNLSKKLRFEIFKRDGFSCQYCGAHPPSAILQVDHIVAVAEGGADDADNLVTACQPCNIGKGAKALSSIPQSLADKAAEVAEREEQLRGYQAVLESRRRRLEMDVDAVVAVYENHVEGYTLTESARISVRKFVDHLGVHSTVEAMELACNRWGANANKVFKYFCGICWNRIRQERGDA